MIALPGLDVIVESCYIMKLYIPIERTLLTNNRPWQQESKTNGRTSILHDYIMAE